MRPVLFTALLTGLLLQAGCPMMSVSDTPIHTDENTIAAPEFPGRHVLFTVKDGKESEPQPYLVQDLGNKRYAAFPADEAGNGTPLSVRFVKLAESVEFVELHVVAGDDLMNLVVPHGYNPDHNYWFARVERPDKGTIKLLGLDKKYADKAWTEGVGRLEKHPEVRTREVKVTDEDTGDLKPVRVIDMKPDELRAFLAKHADEFNVHLWTMKRDAKR